MFGFEDMLHSEYTDLPFKLEFYTIVFLFGICIGSFLNVVIIRLPRHESLIKRSSHCMTCGTKIRPIDLIPVFSWLLDWMGVISLAGTVLGVLGIVKLKDNKDKYFWMSAAAAGVGGVRFIMQMVQLILYFAK